MLARFIITSVVTSLFSTAAFAQNDSAVTCTLNGSTRVISINYPTSSITPCNVNYQKNGTSQTLWQAQNTEGYCEERAAEFIEKQRSWGWKCNDENTAETSID